MRLGPLDLGTFSQSSLQRAEKRFSAIRLLGARKEAHNSHLPVQAAGAAYPGVWCTIHSVRAFATCRN